MAVWEPGLTSGQRKQIERVQKAAFYLILEEDYKSYDEACSKLMRKPLAKRRLDLCLKFARKSLLHPKFSNWFEFNLETETVARHTRQTGDKKETVFKEVVTRTDRYENSPLPFLTKLLNENP